VNIGNNGHISNVHFPDAQYRYSDRCWYSCNPISQFIHLL